MECTPCAIDMFIEYIGRECGWAPQKPKLEPKPKLDLVEMDGDIVVMMYNPKLRKWIKSNTLSKNPFGMKRKTVFPYKAYKKSNADCYRQPRVGFNTASKKLTI